MLRKLIHARSARALFPLSLLAAYAFLPCFLRFAGADDPYFFPLARICGLAVLGIAVGSLLPIPLHRLPKLTVRPEAFLLGAWGAFSAFVIIVFVTSDRIPLLASLQGANANTIALLREEFLKSRTGWQASLVYFNAIFAGFLIPYCLAQMFLHRVRFRWICSALFLVYTLSFVEKAFFFKAIVPVFYLLIQRGGKSPVRPTVMVAWTCGLLVLVTIVSGIGKTESDPSETDFFSNHYPSRNPTRVHGVARCRGPARHCSRFVGSVPRGF